MSHNLETRSFVDEIRHFDKSSFFDFGHPLLNRIAESFVKAAGVNLITWLIFSFSSSSFFENEGAEHECYLMKSCSWWWIGSS